MNANSVLVATVGLGNIDQVRASLLEPMKRSLAAGTWSRIVLVPSKVTEELAGQLRAETRDAPIEICPLPEAGNEDSLVPCREHIAMVFRRLIEQGIDPAQIVLDFTRGTKVMSVAATVAALSCGIRRVQYVVGGQRDARGVVVPGTEQVRHGEL